MKRILPLLAIIFLVFTPSLSLGQETLPETTIVADAPAAPPVADPEATVIIPEAAPPPMPKSDWQALVAAGAIGVFLFTETVKRKLPWFTGKRVWLAILPAIAVAAVLGVGYSDPKLLAKHAGFILLFSVGGRDGLMKILDKVRRGEVPDPPDTSKAPIGPSSVTPSMPPSAGQVPR